MSSDVNVSNSSVVVRRIDGTLADPLHDSFVDSEYVTKNSSIPEVTPSDTPMKTSTPDGVLPHLSSVPPGEFTPGRTRAIPLTGVKRIRTEVEEEDVELLLQRYHESLKFIVISQQV